MVKDWYIRNHYIFFINLLKDLQKGVVCLVGPPNFQYRKGKRLAANQNHSNIFDPRYGKFHDPVAQVGCNSFSHWILKVEWAN